MDDARPPLHANYGWLVQHSETLIPWVAITLTPRRLTRNAPAPFTYAA
ncbi:hypothetical protein [Streptomyces axinellae]